MRQKSTAQHRPHSARARSTLASMRAAALVPTPLVGRDHDVQAVRRMLVDEGVRLVTLVGPPGVGKTRLATEVATTLQDPAGPRIFVDLSSIRDPALVVSVIAEHLEVAESPDQPIFRRVAEYLRHRPILLILDNFEQVVDAGVHVAELVGVCRGLRVLATSREPLRVTWEREYPVRPLSVPDLVRLPNPERLIEHAAVALFVERARSVEPSFSLTEQNAQSVAEICAHLDGLPLAIEMAAARVKFMPPQTLMERLRHRLIPLESRERDLPERHRTLRSAIGWSYGLLTSREQLLFRSLAVFVGGCTLPAAEAICAQAELSQEDVPAALLALVDRSLLQQYPQADGTPRFRMLDTLREFGLEQLLRHAETEHMRARHAGYFLQIAEQAAREVYGSKQASWFDLLDTEHDNLRAALDWAGETPDRIEIEARLSGALEFFWYMRGHWGEGRRRLDQVLSRASRNPSPMLAKVLVGAANLARRQGDYDRAVALSDWGLEVCSAIGDKEMATRFLFILSRAAWEQGDGERARARMEQSLALAREIDHKVRIPVGLVYLGDLHLANGDYQVAAALSMEGLALSQQTGNIGLVAVALRNLGRVAASQGQYARAAAHYAESLMISRSVKGRWITQECLEGLAHVGAALGHDEIASRLFGAADGLRAALGMRRKRGGQSTYEQVVGKLRTRLGESAYAVAWGAGREFQTDQTAEEGIAFAGQLSSREAGTSGLASLTPRELEVATLITQGLSNRQIASSLRISLRTADTHVEHILNKLGFSSRTQIAAWISRLSPDSRHQPKA